MSKLSRDDILKLARLARLDVTDAEVEEYSRELSEVLQYVEQLSAVNIDGLKATNQVNGLTNVMRTDELKDYGYDVLELRKNLPSEKEDHIQVKRMIA